MIRKEFIFITIILLIAFIGISIVKYFGHPGRNSSLAVVVKTDSIQTFWTYYNRATKYRLQGKADSSIISYQEALRLNPDHEDALYYIGNMYMKVGNFDKAHETWDKLNELNPKSERANYQLGNLYFCWENANYFHPEKSKWFFKRANILNKEALNPNIRLGEIALFQNKTNDAFGIFNKLSMMDPKNVEINFIIGYLNWKSGKKQDAILDLERTFEKGRMTIFAKNAAINKAQKCDLFMYWLARNLSEFQKYNISMVMPKVYKKFNQFLVIKRKQLNQE